MEKTSRGMASSSIPWFLASSLLLSLSSLVAGTSVSYDGRAIIIDGVHRVLLSGSIHYPRSTPQMWPDLIQKAKDGGLDAIETYVFWNAHEPRRREYNFEGNLDLIRFLKEIQNAGLYAVLRIGPYACAEWNYGGLPAWLRQIPGVEFRTDSQPFKDEMQNFTTLIANMVKEERLMAPQGGPIIITQIENEYGNIYGPYGDAGKRYINWSAKMAESLNVGVPWIMCQQSDAPQPMINTCNGFYCDNFQPNNANSPKMWTENWTGWFKAWDKPDPHRLVEDVAYSVARFVKAKGTFMNYYMYHGGTNFGRTSGGPYITTSYDYDAPLDEYGNLRQPKWGHLKQLHLAIKSMEKVLTNGDINDTDLGNQVYARKFFLNGTDSGCFISNTKQWGDATVNYEGNNYFVPAWSVSILPDCKQEIYNTAKVNTQTSIMVKKPNQEDNEPADLKWSWKGEPLKNNFYGKGGSFSSNNLLEQITTTADASDYLWYMTSINLSPGGIYTLRVNTTGHVLHAFVNGHLVRSQYGKNGQFSFVYEQAVHINKGDNYISLLSGTVGLKNYGARYELMPAGIVGGPVELIRGNVSVNLSHSNWTYTTGLHGQEKKFFNVNSKQARKWHSGVIPTKKPFTWYKTTFLAPQGTEPVVVDLLGMGKGEAWVNGQSIGRFWPTYIANRDNCKGCDYRGAYKPESCQTGCGEPAQRWYHVPRSFLKAGEDNTLVLFEEAGGDPSQVNFQIVTVGTACGNALEGSTLTLSCQGGRSISAIQFASFGNPEGACQSFRRGSCDSFQARSVVEKACVGQQSCTIDVSEKSLGVDSDCGNIAKRLAVQAVC